MTRHTFLSVFALLVLALSVSQHASAQEHISFITADSITIHGDYYSNNTPPDGLLILLHMNRSNRSVWKSFAEQAVTQRFALLAIDFRGHGESTHGAVSDITFESLTNDDYANMVNDVDGAVQWLRSKPEYAGLPMGIIGASIGANVALAYAAEHKSISAVILMSPGEDYRGVLAPPALQQYGDRPCLIILSEDDNYSSVSSRKLKEAGGEGTELFQYTTGGHGTLMFETQSDLPERLIRYMINNLK